MNEPLPGYRINKQVGTGAGSKISSCVELKSGKTFAVKHVVRASTEDDKFIEQVETEYAVSSKVDDPHLRRSLHIHRVRKLLKVNEIYLVMEWVDGLTLEVARPNRLNTFLTLFQKVALGLDALHAAGFVHADIKPINIMLAPKGVVKIIDFGQACPINHRKDRIQGTPDYIAPEQVRRLTLDQRTDVYNLGATMYWLLTSENYPTILRNENQRGGMNLQSADKPIAPIELNDKIPMALSNLVMECCEENPDKRPTDMKLVGSRLSFVQKMWRKYRENVRAEQHAEGTPAATSASDSSTFGDDLSDSAIGVIEEDG